MKTVTPINFEKEVSELTNQLKSADGYLDCEKVIINNLKKQLKDGFEVSDIEVYLEKLPKYFDDSIAKNKTLPGINYKYANCFVNTLITAPYWHSWIKTIKV